MRCIIGPRKVKRLRERTGLDVVAASARGGRDHMILLFIADGTIMCLMRDGTLETYPMTWDRTEWEERKARKESTRSMT